MAERNASILKARILGTVGLVAGITAVNSYCTQFIAKRVFYHRALGEPLFGHFYQPYAWWVWLTKYYRYAPTTYNYAFVIFAAGVLVSMLVYVLYVGFATRSSRKHEGLHGTARFADIKDIQSAGLLPPKGKPGQGVYCGSFHDPQSGGLRYLRHDGPEHICALAPTRSGKGVGLVVPTLLSWPSSVFVLDRKGENFQMTAGWRGQHADNVILRFDPAEPGTSCSWNPLAEIRFGERQQISDTQNIALMVIDDDGKGIAGNHFRSAAYELLSGLILHALYKSEQVGRFPGLYDCAHMLTGVGDFAAAGTENDLVDDPEEGDPRALSGLWAEMVAVQLDGGDAAAREAKLLIQGVGRRMSMTPARELGSIISTANNALQLYRDPIVAENTTRVDFKVSDLMNHERAVSLYFIITPANQDRLNPLARLLLTRIVQSLADKMVYDESGRSKSPHKHRLLLMLDEFPTLGKLEIFESALAYIAGYGMKAYIITQDVQQLYKSYTSFESIISNCHVRIAYAPNKQETAEWMSKMAGQTTVVKEQITTSGKRFGAVMEQVSRTYQETQRPLMTPDEIMNMPGPIKDATGEKIVEPGEMLVFVAGRPVIRGTQPLYFRDPVFQKRATIAAPTANGFVRNDVPSANKDNPAKRDGKGGGFVIQ